MRPGSSDVAIDYHIVALRKYFENIRMEDHTKDLDRAKLPKASDKAAPARFDLKKFVSNPKPVAAMRSMVQKAVK